MSPAGYWPQLHAAVEAGADSVYFGLKHFTARAKVGFSLEELPDALRTLHQRGVKGFVTFNTLVFEHELTDAAHAIEAIARAGADALIVQDVGALELARRIAPNLELHASTQMSITNAEGVEWARKLGVRRVTLARELSLADLRAIRRATDCELEIFVHGALCVAYSGQCFSSEAWGGRSANRGQCAQACRMPYDLIVDGQRKALGDARYLLSPGDLYALHQVPEIVEIGISALKIEGRYKDADYVALATRAYRQAVDEAWEGRALSISPFEELQLEQAYSRGLAPHFVSGTNHQTVVQGRSPRHRGVLAGRVARVAAQAVFLEPAAALSIAPLKAGDGCMFDAADWRSPQQEEEGGRIYQVLPAGPNLELRFANGALNFERIRVGDLVWRTHDPDLDRAARAFTQATVPHHKQDVRVHVTAVEGQPLLAVWQVVNRPGVCVQASSEAALTEGRNRFVSAELLRDHFGRLGDTPYRLAGVELEITGTPFAPASMLNQLRREAVEKLTLLQGSLHPVAIRELGSLRKEQSPAPSLTAAQLHLLVRTGEQLEPAIAARPASITLDYLDLYGLRPSVERVKTAGIQVRVASPRVLKPGEEKIVDFLLKLDCAILVRSTGLLQALREREHPALIGDFSLNAANSLTADALLELGLLRVTPTHDLNAAQVATLARQIGSERIEAIAYHHLPVFHMEHCVFCRFLSDGTSYKDCGRPCEKHRLEVRDVNGRAHPVMADIGCRNTVFGAEAQEASIHLESWREAGVRHLRLEFVHESAGQVEQVARAFQEALTGGRTFAQLTQALKRTAPRGTTEGSLFVPPNYLSLPILQ